MKSFREKCRYGAQRWALNTWYHIILYNDYGINYEHASPIGYVAGIYQNIYNIHATQTKTVIYKS